MHEHPNRHSGATATFERYADEFAALAIFAHADGVDIDDMIATGRARAGRTLLGCNVAAQPNRESIRGSGRANVNDSSA